MKLRASRSIVDNGAMSFVGGDIVKIKKVYEQ